MSRTAQEVIAEFRLTRSVGRIGDHQFTLAHEGGELIAALEAAGFIIQHRDCLPYKTQQQADQVLEAFRIRMGLG
jgi:hypothetical protein